MDFTIAVSVGGVCAVRILASDVGESFTYTLHRISKNSRYQSSHGQLETADDNGKKTGTTMNALKSRADAQELSYALDEKQHFLASARRNKRLGQWAGEVLGKTDVEAYADEVVLSGLERRNGEFARLRRDFDTAGVTVSDEDIQARMSTILRDVLLEMRNA